MAITDGTIFHEEPIGAGLHGHTKMFFSQLAAGVEKEVPRANEGFTNILIVQRSRDGGWHGVHEPDRRGPAQELGRDCHR